MKKVFVRLAALGTSLFACAHAAAFSTPLTLSYSYAPDTGGLYRYQFRMTLDNHDGSWSPGQGWGWIIFADAYYTPSIINDFEGTLSDLPVGPWGEFTSSTGEHNGPTLGFLLNTWVPTFVGESLSWSGLSAVEAAPGSMTWSSIITVGGATPFQFEVSVEDGGGCRADFDGDAFVTGDDFDGYVTAFEAGEGPADFDGDGFVTGDDFDRYVLAFERGC